MAVVSGALITTSFGGAAPHSPLPQDSAAAAGTRGAPAPRPVTPRPSRPAPPAPPATSAPDGCPVPSGSVLDQAPGHGRTVALTFDDGPGPDTGALLAVLRDRQVHATFFMVGREVEARPGPAAAVAADGHLLANHSWDHRYPRQVRGGWSRPFLHTGMGRTNRLLAAAGGGPVCWFRPPGGFLPKTLLPAARAEGMSVVLWSVDPQDWKLQTPGASRRQVTAEIVRRVTAGIGTPHPLVLMHDGGGDRRAGVAAVGTIIDRYRAHGYRFVRLDGQP